MLILQIALGIVLAVIILAFLPQILALGAVVIVLGLGLLLLGAAIFFFAGKPEILIALLALGVVIGVLFGISLLINRKWIEMNQNSDKESSPSVVGPTVIGRYCARCNRVYQSPKCPTCEPPES